MHVACAVIPLLLLTAGCASVAPDTSVAAPSTAATQPRTPQPAVKPAGKTPPPATAKPATAKPVAAKPVAAKPAAAAPRAPVVAATLDLSTLKEQLRATKAIGVFTKLSLKNKVDDLLDRFREHYQGKPTPTISELRQAYDLLMMKVLSLLQDADQQLASAIVSSREAIWGLLADPKKFAALDV
jgi:hypothetical protein